MHNLEDIKTVDKTDQASVARNDASESLLQSAIGGSALDLQKQPSTAQELPKLQLLSEKVSDSLHAGGAKDQSLASQGADQDDNVGRRHHGGGFYPNPYGPARNPPVSILRANEIKVRDGVITSGEVTRRTRM